MALRALGTFSSRQHLASSAPCPTSRSSARKGPIRVYAIATPIKELEASPALESLEAELQRRVAAAAGGAGAPPAAAAQQQHIAPPPTTGRVVLESPEELQSTWEHRAWVAGGSTLMAATLAIGLSHIDGPAAAAQAAAAAFAAYVLSDLGTAFYHFFVDNYGDADTPVFGGQIAAFQGHHQRPWTITERQFSNNLHKLFRPATVFSVLLLAGAAAGAPMWWDVWSSTFLYLACMSQQFHAWSHMKKSELPAAVVALQDAGLLISRKAHGAHHKAPFNCNYSIVSGWWNPLLDGPSPDHSFWMKFERAIHAATGVEPRSWHEPSHGWQEQQRPDGLGQ